MAENVPYTKTTLGEFLDKHPWAKSCEAFLLVGISGDSLIDCSLINIAASDMSHELMTFLTVSLVCHHNVKTNSQELLVIHVDGDEPKAAPG